MLTSFAVENFKCFESLQLTGLSQITLIGGANNVGKTALLECLYLLLGSPTNPGVVLQLYHMRGLEHNDRPQGSWILGMRFGARPAPPGSPRP